MMPMPFSGPAGTITAPTETETPRQYVQRLPVHLRDLADRLGGEFRRGDRHQHVDAGGLQTDKLAIDCRVCGLIETAWTWSS